MLSYKKDIIYPLLIASLMVSIVIIGLFYTMYQLNTIEASKDLIDKQRFNIVLLQKNILDAESSQRGYLLTNNVTFLEHYESNKLAASEIMKSISMNSDALPALTDTITKVFLLCEQKFNIIDNSISIQLNAGSYASHLTLTKDRGRFVMEEIRNQLKYADNYLTQQREQLSNKAHQTFNSMLFTSIALAICIFGILIFSYLRTLKLFNEILSSTTKVSDLNFKAMHDPLTNLLNRRGFEDRLQLMHENAQLKKQKYAIFYMDLDGFKAINDNYGHEMGDALLIAVSQIFQKILREKDYLSRLGGDEFTLIVQSFKDQEELSALANRLIQALKKPIPVEGKLLNIGVSIGVSIYRINGFKPDQLLSAADSAMYMAKKSGKNCVSFVG